MSRTKIAPQLTALLGMPLYHRGGGLIGREFATAELRALLAVVRAAKREVADVRFAMGEEVNDLPPSDPIAVLSRALARLDRLSVGARSGRGR
jgi:hypothetical protein